jgi:hypothetical protein
MMKSDWIDRNLLCNAAYLNDVTTGVYVMQSTQVQDIFRAGAFGFRKTNAAGRLNQVNKDKKWNNPPTKYARFKFVFLAPMPDDLCHGLDQVETKYLHTAIRTKFGIRNPGRKPFSLAHIANSVSEIQTVATDAVLCFLQNRYAGSAAALVSALHAFVSLAVPFEQYPGKYISAHDFRKAEKAREQVFIGAQKVFDANIAQAFLRCLESGLIVSGLPPCNAF